MARLVRASREEDMAEIQQIYAHEVVNGRASFEKRAPDLEEMLLRRHEVILQGLPHLVAEWNGRVLGFAYATRYRSRPAYAYTIENSVYVTEDARGAGVGKMLVSALIGECERGPWRQLVAIIGSSENFGSIGLHSSLGFRQVGTLKSVGFKLGQWVDTVIMQRPLNNGNETVPQKGVSYTKAR